MVPWHELCPRWGNWPRFKRSDCGAFAFDAISPRHAARASLQVRLNQEAQASLERQDKRAAATR
jgi:hypothetical protein